MTCRIEAFSMTLITSWSMLL